MENQSQEPDKYWVITANTITNMNKKLTKFQNRGYTLMGAVRPYNGIGGDCFMATLYLSNSNLDRYRGFLNIDKGSETQREYEQLGYVPISEYSKHITWAKPVRKVNLVALREAILKAYEVTETWDVRDDNLANNILRHLEVALSEIEGTRVESSDRELPQ